MCKSIRNFPYNYFFVSLYRYFIYMGKLINKDQLYSIKDLENISSVKAHTIRIWEKRYSLFTPRRTATNIRLYTDQDLKKLLNIFALLSLGYKISKIGEYNNSEIEELVANAYINKNNPTIELLLVEMINFNESNFNRILDIEILKYGFEDTLDKLISPLFTKIGLLWQTNSINPAHEHFVSNLLKQKLFFEINKLQQLNENTKTFILFLSENEQHEIGLLNSFYLIKKAGFKVIYLGQNMPTIDVIKVWRQTQADFLFTFFVSNLNNDKQTEILETLSSNTNYTNIITAGSRSNLSKKLNNISEISNSLELKVFLSNLKQ